MRGGAPRVLGVAALAVATAGAVSAGTPVPTGSATGGMAGEVAGMGAALAKAAPADADRLTASVKASEMSLERPVRVRVSRDGVRQGSSLPQRLGSQAADAIAGAQLRAAEERAAAKKAAAKKAAAKKAAEKKAAAKRAAEAKRWRLPLAKGAYRLTAEFGQCSGLWSRCHTGLDFAAPSGTPIRAIAAGKVVESAYSGAYGNMTVIRLPDGTEMWYAHQTDSVVSTGQRVKAGQKIGTVGSTGNSTGPHLHLEVRRAGGDAVDPHRALRAEGVRF